MMEQKLAAPLNMARRLRPRTFREIIGQDFSVRMLQNSLYLNRLFPVYLFSGQRGCGKTTSARVFAAAINCHVRSQFQQDPAQTIPCLQCDSCLAMGANAHPDFIELDAASHTGVDDVRSLLETCTYVPLLGTKKIYLIDEAHMLSKAACNALLKVLEEPPADALFILATTEPAKIPVTVRSRCFQAIFRPLERDKLADYLAEICAAEGIMIAREALFLIIQETDGSVRDALNMLEQLRCMGQTIDGSMIRLVRGLLPKDLFFALLDALMHQNTAALCAVLENSSFKESSPQFVLQMIVDAIRALIRLHVAENVASGPFVDDQEVLRTYLPICSLNRLQALLQLVWEYEEAMAATKMPHACLETLLLLMCRQVNVTDLRDVLQGLADHAPEVLIAEPSSQSATVRTPVLRDDQSRNEASSQQYDVPQTPQDTAWCDFVTRVAAKNDHMLTSILRQCRFITANEAIATVQCAHRAPTIFVTDKIKETRAIWHDSLMAVFPPCTQLELVREEAQQSSEQIRSELLTRARQGNAEQAASQRAQKPVEVVIDYQKNPEQWPLTTQLLHHFPGTIKRM